MESIKSERLEIRSLKIEDLDEVMNFWGNDEVMKFCGGSSSDKNQIENVIKNYINLQNERGFSVFAVVLQEINKVIGACGYNYANDNNEIELIYHFATKYWGKGYATEATRACIEFARKNLCIHKIIASVDPRNEASRRLLERLEFKYMSTKWFEDTEQEELYYELIM